MPTLSVEQLVERQAGLSRQLADLGTDAEPAKRRATQPVHSRWLQPSIDLGLDDHGDSATDEAKSEE